MKRGTFLMRNSKGLSDVLATLMIILLVLVAVGIIWVVVRNVVQGGSGQVDLRTKCLAVDLQAVKVTANGSNYAVVLKRGSDSQGAIGGVQLSFYTANGTASNVLEFGIALNATQERTQTVSAGLANATRMDYTLYFLDGSGNRELCPNYPQTQTF